MAALTVDFRKHSGPTPADDMAAQIITDCGNFTLDFKQHGFCASPLFLQTLGPWFPNEMQNLLSSEKRTLDHWATVQFFFSTAQLRRFWRCLWLRSGLVALFLKTSERGDSWCTDSMQLQSTPCEALTSVEEDTDPAWQRHGFCPGMNPREWKSSGEHLRENKTSKQGKNICTFVCVFESDFCTPV